MQTPNPFVRAKAAILTLAEIKAATDAFDRGDANAHDTLEAIAEVIAAWQAEREPRREAA